MAANSQPAREAGAGRGRLKFVFALTAAFMVVEFIGGWLTNSLALMADAGHMFTDVFALGLALFAVWLSARPATPERSFGYYRAEILAALLNALLLFGISAYILYEAWQRFKDPPQVQSLPMLVVAVAGLIVNLISMRLLGGHAGESLNVKAAFLEVVSDLLGSIGVMLAALIMYFTGWSYADPLFSALIGLFIIPRTWRMLREAVDILLEATPPDINLDELRATMEAVPGVVSAHDLHVWTITSGYLSLSAHLVVTPGCNINDALVQLNKMLADRYSINHTTLQTERGALPEEAMHA